MTKIQERDLRRIISGEYDKMDNINQPKNISEILTQSWLFSEASKVSEKPI